LFGRINVERLTASIRASLDQNVLAFDQTGLAQPIDESPSGRFQSPSGSFLGRLPANIPASSGFTYGFKSAAGTNATYDPSA